jgi:hypothetical protein
MIPTEPTLLDSFKSNPVYMGGAVLVGAFAIFVAISAIIAALKLARLALVLGVVAVLTGVVPIGLGGVGKKFAEVQTDAAVRTQGLTPTDKKRMQSFGQAMASHAMNLGVGVGLVPIALGVVAIALSRRKAA